MSSDPVGSFWDERHRAVGGLRSGGHLSFDETDNRRFYMSRLGQLLRIIGDRGTDAAPLSLLDAGCGRGWFLAQLRSLGHDVDGVDVSRDALATARQLAPDAALRHGEVADFDSPRTYDVVYAIDLLIHVVDDDRWLRTLQRLAMLTSMTGRLVVTDDATAEDASTPATYIRFRPLGWYVDALEPYALRHVATHPYDFRRTRGGFHVFETAHPGAST